MRDYSSAKIELMALKWSVCDKFKDYLLGSKFTVFTDNNRLCYIKSSKLGAAQIRWLSELALYDFDIVYRTGKSHLVADTLSRRPEVEEEIEKEIPSESDDDEWIAVSYQVEEQGGRISSMEFNQVISELVGGTRIDKKLKDRIQVVDVANEKLNGKATEVATRMVSLFNSITPKEMAEFQHQDNQIAPIFTYVEQDQKPSKKVTYQIRSKLARKLALQWDRLILKQRRSPSTIHIQRNGISSISSSPAVSSQGTYGSSRSYGSSRHRSNVRSTLRTGLLAIYGQGPSKLGY